MNYAWKILDIYADGEKITSAKYHCVVFDGENTVETEGYATFDGEAKTAFSEVTEEMVAQWAKESLTINSECLVEKRLSEQLANLAKKPAVAPWKPQIFTLEDK
jgi:hypothetical protein